ncbi:MAG: glycosyl hydrolase family 18 protein [Bacteroidia bacterium]
MKQKKFFLVMYSVLASFSFLFAQTTTHKSTHQQEYEAHKKLELQGLSTQTFETSATTLSYKQSQACSLQKVVYGWHPYWNNSSSYYRDYQWNLLSHLAYFGAEVNPATGNFVTTNNWATAAVVDTAKSYGVKVHLTITLFANHSQLWASTTAQQTLINNIVTAVQSRQADGVCIDFEAMGGSDKVPFTAFMTNLATAMHTQIPNSEVTIALAAVDYGPTFDVPALSAALDLLIIMGYDYYWSGSSTTGPTDPLYPMISGSFSMARSVNYYLSMGCPKQKLCLAMPYYGREWFTANNTVPGTVLSDSTSNSRTYATIRNNTSGYYANANYGWNQTTFSDYYVFQKQPSGAWKQCFMNGGRGMKKRLDVVNEYGIRGMGIWALGYDDGYANFWNIIQEKFSDCVVLACNDTLYDMGGPERNYYNSQDYTFSTFPSTSSGQVQLSFFSFSLDNTDTLSIYDGTFPNATLIGHYTGTNSPNALTSTNHAFSFRFKSNSSTTAAGWTAYKSCTNVSNLEELEGENALKIYPIPANDFLIVENIPFLNQTKPPFLINSFGQKIERSSFQIIENKGIIKVNNLSEGIYYLYWEGIAQGVKCMILH